MLGEAVALRDGETLALPVVDALLDEEALSDADTLGVALGVPKQMHVPSMGAPQERRQHSAGHVVRVGEGDTEGEGEGEGEALGDAVIEAVSLSDWEGPVCEGVGVMQVQTMSGKLPAQE